MSNLRIFIEFAGHFLPILGDGGIHHVFPVPANCSTINDVAYEILKKYDLHSLAPDGVELKIRNKYKLLSRDNITNCIREGDQIHISPRVIPSKWNEQTPPSSSRKRKKPSHNNLIHDSILPQMIAAPPHKKRRLAHCTSDSVVSNVSSASSSVTVYSSSDPEDILPHSMMDHETVAINGNGAHDASMEEEINNEPNTDTTTARASNESSDSDSSSDSTSDDEDSDENSTDRNHNNSNHDNEENVSLANQDGDGSSISTLNDALKALEKRKSLLMNDTTQQEYLRCVKENDRIRIWMEDEWRHGTVVCIANADNMELLMDNSDSIHVCLEQMEWEFEPENFIAPRSRKLMSNYNGKERCDSVDRNQQNEIKQWIEESGHERMRNNELRCDEVIAYKLLELADWEPVYSKYKTGEIVEIEGGIAVIERNKKKERVRISNLCEVYKLKRKEKKGESPDRIAFLQKVKQQRKARRQRQKQHKAAGRCQSM